MKIPGAGLISFFCHLYVALGFGLFLTAADNYLSKQGLLPLAPTQACAVFLGSILLVILGRGLLSEQFSYQLFSVLRLNLSVIVPFGVIVFMSMLLALHPTAFWGDDRKWIYLPLYDFSIFLFAIVIGVVSFIHNRYHYFVLVALLTLLCSIWYEMWEPGTFSNLSTRAAGFPGNSNWGALVTVMVCAVTLRYDYEKARFFDMLVLAGTGVAVYATLSRSGMLNFLALVLFYAYATFFTGRGLIKRGLVFLLSASMLAAFFLTVIPLLSESTEMFTKSNKTNRVSALLEGEMADDGSGKERMAAAETTLDLINESPIFGHGTGFNRKLRPPPHNLYLKLWVDSGVFGVAAYVTLLGMGFWLFSRRKFRPGQGFILATAIGSFFSHNVLDQRTFLILFGTATTVSLYEAARNKMNNADIG